MKTVTYEEFLKFEPCWLEDEEKRKQLERYGKRKKNWTALDILNLPENEVSAEHKLWAVLREDFIDAPILHEFACQCREKALSLIENPNPKSVAAITAKRAWLKGEISDEELADARADARAAWAAWAALAAWDATGAAWDAARDAARKDQMKMLVELLNGTE